MDELSTPRHPLTGDTMLHVAARTNNAVLMRACFDSHQNPLLRNRYLLLAVESATDAAMRAELHRYSLWRPTELVTRWFGPYFRGRARAWLLVCARWSRDGTRNVARDVQLLIVRFVAAAEETFVRRVE
jgi:hypothetical protein